MKPHIMKDVNALEIDATCIDAGNVACLDR